MQPASPPPAQLLCKTSTAPVFVPATPTQSVSTDEVAATLSPFKSPQFAAASQLQTHVSASVILAPDTPPERLPKCSRTLFFDIPHAQSKPQAKRQVVINTLASRGNTGVLPPSLRNPNPTMLLFPPTLRFIYPAEIDNSDLLAAAKEQEERQREIDLAPWRVWAATL